MSKKMTGKQETTGAFDLDAFVNAGDSVVKPKKSPARPEKPPHQKEASRSVGRPPVAKEAARDQNVQMKLTEAELSHLKEQAGLVPISIYLRAKLKEFGVI